MVLCVRSRLVGAVEEADSNFPVGVSSNRVCSEGVLDTEVPRRVEMRWVRSILGGGVLAVVGGEVMPRVVVVFAICIRLLACP